ncbi:MAG: hypothetical protein LBT43_09880 [Prevotella sp.]|jgi:hypothetical protein|nr:hypothetical protein [Prevotella sp.]
MIRPDLIDLFIEALYKRIDKKSDLVNFLADSLNIEKESAYRRLNKKVYFSVSEIGLLASKLGISIDTILKYQEGYISPPVYRLHLPKSASSIDGLADWMAADIELLKSIPEEQIEYAQTFIGLPIEFVIPYNSLLKFLYFKWGYYYVGSNIYKNFSLWEIPTSLVTAGNTIMEILKKWESKTYLWDMSAIWCLTKDISYFYSIHALSLQDVESIKLDIHNMLYDLEKISEGISTNYFNADKTQIYISTIVLGTHLTYISSKSKKYSCFYTYFISSNYSDDYQTYILFRDWINAMKKVCTLISNSGAKERRLFFDEQHQIVEHFLSTPFFT